MSNFQLGGFKMKKTLTILLSIILILALSACTANSSRNSDSSSGHKKVLKLNNGLEPSSFDPPKGFDAASWNPLNNLMEGLVRLGKDNEPHPAIAEKWDVSSDGKTYTFHIRKNAKWSNGDPVTANDFEFAWKRLLDPKTASPAAFLGYLIEGAEAFNSGKGSSQDVKVSATDKNTLQVTLTAPQKYFLNIITNPCFFPINEKVAEKNPKWFANAKTFVGNGPFNLTTWKHNSQMVFKKNNNYWDKKNVKLDEVDWAMIDDPNTEYQTYQSGNLDEASVPPGLSDKLFKEGKVKVEQQAGTSFISMNVHQAPFTNQKIRKAFAMSIDGKQIVDYVTKWKQTPAFGFVSPGFKDPDGNDFREKNGDMYKFNPTEAKKLLQEGMKEEGYSKLPPVTFTYSTTDENKRIAEAIQEMLKKNLGVNVKLANMEWNVFSTEQKAGKFQFSKASFLADYGDPINYLENFQTGMQMNSARWSNKEYDALIKKAKNEKDEKARYNEMYQAEKILFKDMPYSTILFYNQPFLQKSNVTEIVHHPVGYLDLKWASKK